MNFIRRYPALSYFLLAFALSWLGALLVAAPHVLRGQPIPNFAGLMMFPAMLVGPSMAGMVLTRIVDGPAGLRDLFLRMRRFRFSARWYAVLLIPPVFVLGTLLLMKTFYSPVYAPNRFFPGAGFGIVAGFFEEIGWTGFAFPKLRQKLPALPAAVVLGVVWACWHIPVVNYLGTATPHGAYWWEFFLAFACAMMAMRVLICWLYSNTRSVVAGQLMHAVSTGSLVVFSPQRVGAAQEALWYLLYGVALWLLAATLVAGGKFARA